MSSYPAPPTGVIASAPRSGEPLRVTGAGQQGSGYQQSGSTTSGETSQRRSGKKGGIRGILSKCSGNGDDADERAVRTVPASQRRTNPGCQSPMGFIASGPFYSGPDTNVLPPMPPSGWLLGRGVENPPKKCLVLDLDETLVHSSFNPVVGADMILPVEIEDHVYNVYVRKRPGVDEFLRRAAELFEIVVFTASLNNYADPVLDHLDRGRVCRHRLYRESCTYCGGFFIKDLTRLGRPLDDTVIIDNSPASYQFQPRNAIGILTWYEDPTDRELEKLMPLLEDIAKPGPAQAVLARSPYSGANNS